MTDEQWQHWRKIVTRCERLAPVTIGSKLRHDTVLAVDEELRQLRRQVAKLEGRNGDTGSAHQVRRTA